MPPVFQKFIVGRAVTSTEEDTGRPKRSRTGANVRPSSEVSVVIPRRMMAASWRASSEADGQIAQWTCEAGHAIMVPCVCVCVLGTLLKNASGSDASQGSEKYMHYFFHSL